MFEVALERVLDHILDEKLEERPAALRNDIETPKNDVHILKDDVRDLKDSAHFRRVSARVSNSIPNLILLLLTYFLGHR